MNANYGPPNVWLRNLHKFDILWKERPGFSTQKDREDNAADWKAYKIYIFVRTELKIYEFKGSFERFKISVI